MGDNGEADEQHNIIPNADSLPSTTDNDDLLSYNLSEAIKAGDFEKVKEILNKHPHMVKARYAFQFESGNVEHEGVTPLIQAAAYPNSQILAFFLQKGADANEKTTSHGASPLHIATGFGHWESFNLLVAAGARLDSRSNRQRTLLHQAAFSEDVRFSRALLSLDGADANVVDNENYTPIYIAAQEGHKDVVELLIQHKANVDIACHDGTTALFIAAQKGHTEVVELLIQHEANVHIARNGGATVLNIAARHGHIEVIKLLIQHGANVNLPSSDGSTALYVAAYNGRKEVIELLIQHNANVNMAHDDQSTPLYVAAQEGHTGIVEILLAQKEISANIACEDGSTALYMAAQEGHTDVVERLLAHNGIDANITCDNETTALYMASQKGYTEIVERLLAHNGIDVNIACDEKTTALYIAASKGHTDIVKGLLSNKQIDVNIACDDGSTALYIAANKGHTEVVEMLLAQEGIDVNHQNTDGWNPLIISSCNGHSKIVELLLAFSPQKANRNAVTIKGWTAIQVAASNEHIDVFNQLISDDEVDLTISDGDGDTVLYDTASWLSDEDTLRVLKTPQYFPDEPLKAKLCRASSHEYSSVEPALRKILKKEEIGKQDIESVLFWAVTNGAEELLKEGLQHNLLDLESFLRGSRVPLHVAARTGNCEGIQILIEKGADVDCLATHNSTAIHLAAEHGHLAVVEKLLNAKTKASGDEPTSYSKQLERITRKDSNGESAISLAVRTRNKLVEEFLWKEYKLYGNLCLASSPPHAAKENILEIAAKYERPGEESVLKSFLQQNKKPIDGWTALHWAVSESQPVVVWWLISKGGYVRTKTLQEVRKLQKENSTHADEIIQRLLHDPPPILPSVANNNDDELVQKPSLEDYEDCESQGTIVDFYGYGENIEMHYNQKSIKDIIYQQGVKSLMEESRKQNFHNLAFMKQHIQEGQHRPIANQPVQQTPKRPNEPEGPSQAQQPAKSRANDATVTELTGGIDVPKERKFSGTREFRWIHIPLNDIKLLEDLVTRISTDEKKTQKEYRPLMQFLRESWTPCAVGGGKHYMKSQFVEEVIDPDKQTAKALYIPYLALSERELKTNKSSSNRPARLPIHDAMTLDQYYYVALSDTTRRDDTQVLSRYLDRYHKEEITQTPRILAVGDLWIWIIDNKTMITATTDQYSEFVDTVFESIASLERSRKRLLPKSVDTMVKFVLGMQTAFFMQENIPLNSKESKSVLNVFRESIRDVTEKESRLYDRFSKSLDRDDDDDENEHMKSHNNIKEEVDLLWEIKDIRDELIILVTLVEEQQMVWKQVFQSDSPNISFLDDCTPQSVKSDLDDMVSEANLVIDSINSLLDLRQKQASIKEAEWGRKQAESGRKQQEDTARQSNIIMVFTVVTIIFLPLSFLSSLFALNVSDFPHEGSSVAFKGWWIFPMIFGISAGVSLPLIWVAFNVNSLLDWSHNTVKSKLQSPWRPRQEDIRPILRELTEKGRLRNLYRRSQSTENDAPV